MSRGAWTSVGAQHAAPLRSTTSALRPLGSTVAIGDPLIVHPTKFVIPSGVGRRRFCRFAPAKRRPAQSRNLLFS